MNWSLCVLNYFKKEMIYYKYIEIQKNRDNVYGWWQYKLLSRKGVAIVLFDQQHVQINNVENSNST